MRYLCTNPDCGMFAKLIAGSRPACSACGQRVLDERVMLKHGRSVQSIVASKGRVVQAPTQAPRQDESILDPPAWREERELAKGPPYEKTKTLFTKEQIAAELANGSVRAISQKHHIALGTVRRLLEDFGVENSRARGNRTAAPAVAEKIPTTPASTPAPIQAGFTFQITRSRQAKSIVIGDVDALAAAVEHLHDGSRFNLTVTLEEAS